MVRRPWVQNEDDDPKTRREINLITFRIAEDDNSWPPTSVAKKITAGRQRLWLSSIFSFIAKTLEHHPRDSIEPNRAETFFSNAVSGDSTRITLMATKAEQIKPTPNTLAYRSSRDRHSWPPGLTRQASQTIHSSLEAIVGGNTTATR
ncbi:hypothetical protein KSP40_PGU010703 [Platanthera guangdongensis]|uniref:Uncharacterized protein n=1 Tax=Platanthera guangdongensis TaxID=2320717 RepID=A0ABR2MVH6_9ASPA